MINIRKESFSAPSCIDLVNGEQTSDPVAIANAFNNFFSTIGHKVQEKVYSSHNHFSRYLQNPNDHSFFASPTCPNEIADLISDFDRNKACGPNSIPVHILLLLKTEISKLLSDLINLSFASGRYPDSLKIAEIIPAFKKGSRLSVNNYRPISLLSNINKIFEKLMFNRLYNFLNLHSCIYDLQFGFRSQHSTVHTLISITEKIREALDKGHFACGIFLDLKKAFDTVDHKILLKKLEYYGVRGTTNKWFTSYLSDRKQLVSINGFKSNLHQINIGVPQGSVLGPLLFLIYINDLHSCVKKSTVHHFSDDTNLLNINNNKPC